MKILILFIIVIGVVIGLLFVIKDKKPTQTNLLNSNPFSSKQPETQEQTQQATSQQVQGQPQKQPQAQSQSSFFNENKPAPEFIGITKWLNPEKALTLQELRGKVVLVDFWTYTCINCIRTLPYVTKWYDKYRDQGFVVIGVHTPEFAYEKETKNVLNAIKQYNIHYPVPQDNDFATWKAYDNQYWPAEYLIDKKGIIRRTHFGEGEYKETEQAIQELLKEAG